MESPLHLPAPNLPPRSSPSALGVGNLPAASYGYVFLTTILTHDAFGDIRRLLENAHSRLILPTSLCVSPVRELVSSKSSDSVAKLKRLISHHVLSVQSGTKLPREFVTHSGLKGYLKSDSVAVTGWAEVDNASESSTDSDDGAVSDIDDEDPEAFEQTTKASRPKSTPVTKAATSGAIQTITIVEPFASRTFKTVVKSESSKTLHSTQLRVLTALVNTPVDETFFAPPPAITAAATTVDSNIGDDDVFDDPVIANVERLIMTRIIQAERATSQSLDLPPGQLTSIAQFIATFCHNTVTNKPSTVYDYYHTFMTTLDFGGEEDIQSTLLGVVEEVITSEAFAHIFSPAGTADSDLDKAMSTRITVLNRSGYGLEHLGIEYGSRLNDAATDAAQFAGDILSTLDNKVTPRDKLEVIDTTFKSLVQSLDGMKLPGRATTISKAQAKPVVNDPLASSTTATDSHLDLEIDSLLANQKAEAEALENLRKRRNVEPMLMTKPLTESSTALLPLPPRLSRPGTDADSLLPLLILAIASSNPPKLVSNLRYIRRYHTPALLTSREEYILTAVEAAITYLCETDFAAIGFIDIPAAVSFVPGIGLDELAVSPPAKSVKSPTSAGASTTAPRFNYPDFTAFSNVAASTVLLPAAVVSGVAEVAGGGVRAIGGAYDSLLSRLRPNTPSGPPPGPPPPKQPSPPQASSLSASEITTRAYSPSRSDTSRDSVILSKVRDRIMAPDAQLALAVPGNHADMRVGDIPALHADYLRLVALMQDLKSIISDN